MRLVCGSFLRLVRCRVAVYAHSGTMPCLRKGAVGTTDDSGIDGSHASERNPYQSSFTASASSRPAALRPAAQAVTTPAAITAAKSAASLPHGTSRSIVQ